MIYGQTPEDQYLNLSSVIGTFLSIKDINGYFHFAPLFLIRKRLELTPGVRLFETTWRILATSKISSLICWFSQDFCDIKLVPARRLRKMTIYIIAKCFQMKIY